MSISVTFNSAHRILLASEFFMARRPVVDRHQNLVAYELLFCTTDGGNACLDASADDQPTTASVIADVYQHGMGRVISDLVGILYIDAAALMSDIFQFLPQQNVVLEITEMPEATPAIVQRLMELTRAGFRFALVVHDSTKDIQEELLPLIEGVRIDITGKDRDELSKICRMFQMHQKKMLAEKVETIEQYKTCLDLGFDFFQGYYFTRPHILDGKKLLPSQLAIAELMALITSDADTSVIEHSIKGDVALGLNLLRLVNTPTVSVHRIDSLRQALMVLGRNQLQRWLQVMLYADHGMNGPSMQPLLSLATTRGRLIELIAQKLKPTNRGIADTGFTVGIMSLMDTAFSIPMEELLQQIPVVDEVSDALLHRQSYFGQLLSLVEHTEWRQKTDTPLLHACRNLHLSYNDLYLLQLAAFEWSDQVTRNMH